MFPRARVRPRAEETPEDEEASLLQQRDLTLRSALDQIQQRRRHPRHSPPPPPRPLATKEEEGERRAAVPTPAPHPQGGGGPLEALRQREWLLNLQEQQELQRLRAPATPPRQEECPRREEEEQLLFNGECPPSPPPTPAPPPKEPSSPRSPARGAAGGWRRGARGGPTSRFPLRGRRGAPPHRFQRGWMPSYQHPRREGMGSSSSSPGPVRGEGKEEHWQEKALPRSEQDEASMLARALELSRLDDVCSRAEEDEQVCAAVARSGGRGPARRQRRRGGWRPEGPPPGVVVGSIDAQQAEGGVSFGQWLSLCSRYMPLLAQGLRELQRTAPLPPAHPVPFPPPGWPHLPPPPLAAPALIAELTGSALQANHCGQLPPPPLLVAASGAGGDPQGQEASRGQGRSSRQPQRVSRSGISATLIVALD